MAKISNREKILLGYGSSNSSSRRNSEVDFSDVFGGPPRYSSTQEFYDIDDIVDHDEDDEFQFGLTDKPVFGEQNVVARKRYPSEDFYGDIFGGDQPSLLSCSLSPRKHKNPFSPGPGTRSMSPSLSPTVDPCAAPSKFSLPGRVASTDIMTSTSMSQNKNLSGRSRSRFNQTVQNHSAVQDDVLSTLQASTLTCQVSVNGNESTGDSRLDGSECEGNFMDSKEPEFQNENIQFHFSIYKWPSKAVPFVMSSRKRSPSRSKEILTNERYLSSCEGYGNACLVTKNIKDVTINDSISSSKRRIPSAQARVHDSYNGATVSVVGAECKSGDDIGPVVFNINDNVVESPSNGTEGTKEVPNLSQKSSDALTNGNCLKNSLKKTKSNMSSLGSLFGEEKKGKKKAAAEKGRKKNKVNEIETLSMKDDITGYKVNKSKVHKSSTRAKESYDISINIDDKIKVVQKSSTGTKDDGSKCETAGKVKDFVKIFNEDSTLKAKSNDVGRSRSWRWKIKTNFEADTDDKTFVAENHDEAMQDSCASFEKTLTESVEVVDGESFLSSDHVFTYDGNDRVAGSTTSASNNEPNIDGVRDSAPKTNADSVDDRPDEGLVQDFDMQLATDPDEETKSHEHKVQQWSKGKEGNIRALLSTMQYVLWPNSGWKPIPLVDIIEANAVKKAYQRALLCLHPDKLQQKGAASHQKFIAEKVFDILQEAWDQFNAIGLLS